MSNSPTHRIFKLPMAKVLKVLAANGAQEIVRQAPAPVPREVRVEPKKTSRILTYAELKSVKGITATRPTISRWEEKGQFPQRIQISPGRIGWYEHEVDEHVSEKAEARHLSVRNKRKPCI